MVDRQTRDSQPLKNATPTDQPLRVRPSDLQPDTERLDALVDDQRDEQSQNTRVVILSGGGEGVIIILGPNNLNAKRKSLQN